MSAVLEPQASTAESANDDTVEVIDRAEIKDGQALVAYSRTEAGLMALKEDLAGKVYDLTTVKGNDLARQDRQRCVVLRTSLEKKRLEFKRPVLDIGKKIDAEAKRINDEILRLEAPIDAAIKADEARREEIRQQKAAAEAARLMRHRDGIAKIRSYADAARRPDMTAERVLKGLSALETMVIDQAAWEEFHVEARHALDETIEAVKAEYTALVAKEAEAARLEQQRIEQEQRQAELDAERRRLEEQAAELKAQQDAMAAQIVATVPVPAADVLEKTVAVAACTGVAIVTTTVDAGGVQATLMDSPWQMPAEIPVGEVVEMAEPPAAPALIDDGREWKLGEIAAAFGVGITAEFVRSLGIEPVRIDKRALLFTTSQALDLRARLVARPVECGVLR